jgi:hypothetical protein
VLLPAEGILCKPLIPGLNFPAFLVSYFSHTYL